MVKATALMELASVTNSLLVISVNTLAVLVRIETAMAMVHVILLAINAFVRTGKV